VFDILDKLTTHIIRFIVAMRIYHVHMGYLRSTNQVSHSESLFHQLIAPHIQLTSYTDKSQKNIVKPHSHIKNSYQLVHKLNGLPIEENYELIFLNVVSLFTNISLNLILESVSNRWCQISKGTNIPKNEILN